MSNLLIKLNKTTNRIRILSWLFVILFSIIVIRLLYVRYAVVVPAYHTNKIAVKPTRHNIYDRMGNILATNIVRYNFYLNPSKTIYADQTVYNVTQLFPKLSQEKIQHIRETLATRKNMWLPVMRNISMQTKHSIIDLGIEGAEFEKTSPRIYPYKNLFSHIIGYTNYDNYGVSGIEKYFNQELISQDVTLSLDARLQHILRSEIFNTVKTFKAKSGFGIISNIKTGEIIAIVSVPDYNPNNIGNPSAPNMLNIVTQNLFNLGSVFKIFSMALGLENGVQATDSFFVNKKIKTLGKFFVQDSHAKSDYLTAEEIFAHSSNVGIVQITKQIGLPEQRKFFTKIGLFDSKINLEIPGSEYAQPLYNKNNWTDTEHYTASYGYGISITPLKFHEIASSILNDGYYTPLTLLKKSNANSKNTNKPEISLVSPQTSKTLKLMMRKVITIGTARNTKDNGYNICGKTGTTEKYDFKLKEWNKKRNLASFYAIFPCNNPRYALYIGIDEPHSINNTPTQGGTIVAPITNHIVQTVGPILNIVPDKKS